MCQICNQCGVSYNKTNYGWGQKCNRCFSLNKTFTARYKEGLYSRKILTTSCQLTIETYKLIVDNNFEGNLVNANIPYKAKNCLISLGYYKEYADCINEKSPKGYAPKAKDVLQEYSNLYNTNSTLKTL